MNIYISGITGTGMGPLALMARQAGFTVCGSDLNKGAIYDELIRAGIEVCIGQDGEFLREKLAEGVDWFCYTSALPDDHVELTLARGAGVKVTKRDDLTAFLVEKLGLKMVAVAGTHGKTTTTAMIVWAAMKLGLPISYLVGTTLGFAQSGSYHKGDKYFVYEADEYDRNFLKYHPWIAVVPAVSYDHPDIYPTREDYRLAFEQFKAQSERVIEDSSRYRPDDFRLAGEARRRDASLAAEAVLQVAQDEAKGRGEKLSFDGSRLVEILDEFPGVGRRFEKIKEGVYSDYAHHPEEIAATMDVVKDEKRLHGYKGVVVVYQPHQNTRQHEVREGYKDAFMGADKIFWLPTYLTRENPNLAVLTPEELTKGLSNREVAETAEANEVLADKLKQYVLQGYLVILMTAGPADGWLRSVFDRD
ncbi:hypothetical protein IKE13_02865 [Candidatus Saccharibacteria bacterium]|nr:hypothetical protein [Candidatus Saccharibacteria bacterium]